MSRLPLSRLALFHSKLDPPGSVVVGVIWRPDGTFETVLALPTVAARYEVA
jgi:hypothetical protein